MNCELRRVKSDFAGRCTRTNGGIKIERCRTPLRFSRRLKHLPPCDTVRDELSQTCWKGKQIISKESSIQIESNEKPKQRKLHYSRTTSNSKAVIKLLSAPQIGNGKLSSSKSYIPIKQRLNNKRRCSRTEKILKKRKKYVLQVLNQGDLKDIEKLPSVGCKTAERIVIYRRLKGRFSRISDLAGMPKFPKRMFNNFVAQNFLRRSMDE